MLIRQWLNNAENFGKKDNSLKIWLIITLLSSRHIEVENDLRSLSISLGNVQLLAMNSRTCVRPCHYSIWSAIKNKVMPLWKIVVGDEVITANQNSKFKVFSFRKTLPCQSASRMNAVNFKFWVCLLVTVHLKFHSIFYHVLHFLTVSITPTKSLKKPSFPTVFPKFDVLKRCFLYLNYNLLIILLIKSSIIFWYISRKRYYTVILFINYLYNVIEYKETMLYWHFWSRARLRLMERIILKSWVNVRYFYSFSKRKRRLNTEVEVLREFSLILL